MLEDMSSMELTMWQVFLVAAHERQEAAMERARQDHAIMGGL